MTAEVRVSAEGEGEGSQKGNNRCLVRVTGSLAAREWLLLCNERQGVMPEPHAHPASFPRPPPRGLSADGEMGKEREK